MHTDELSSISLALLGLIRQAPRSGYDLRKIFARSPMGHFSSSTGAIYPALRRLEEGGLIEGRHSEGMTLRPREVYHLTSKGQERVRAELALPITGEDVSRHLDHIMLRLAFIDQFMAKADVLDFMRRVLAQVKTHRQSLEDYFDAHGRDLPACGRYALEAGLASVRAHELVVRRAIQDTSHERASGPQKRSVRRGTPRPDAGRSRRR